MDPLFQPLSTDGIEAVVTRPTDRLIEGDPVHTCWDLLDEGGLNIGIWSSTPGKWRLNLATYTEYCRIRSGVTVITDAEGNATTLKAGDSFVMNQGFTGTWEVIETTTKDFVIKTW